MEIEEFKQLTKNEIINRTKNLIYTCKNGPSEDEVTYISEKGSKLTVLKKAPKNILKQGLGGVRYLNYILVQLSIMDSKI